MENYKNIWVLPTDKPSRLHFDSKLFLSLNYQDSKTINSIVEGKNIYITSEEDIKDGNWCIADYVTDFTDLKGNPSNDGNYHIVKTNNIILGNVEHGQQLLFSFNNSTHEIRYCKKIILTTDPDLIKDGVQAIDDEFLQWFVQNTSCEWAELGFMSNITSTGTIRQYKIIIPQESNTLTKLEIAKNLAAIGIGKEECDKCFGPGENQKNDIGYEKCTNCDGKGNLQSFDNKISFKTHCGCGFSYEFCGKHDCPKEEPKQETLEEVELAILFHNTYERLAPSFGYETRVDTKSFDTTTPNGKLMIAVSKEIIKCQQERMYSDEEVLDIISKIVDKLQFYFSDNLKGQIVGELFNEFKKK